MGLAEVQATIIGDSETREYTFMVDTGATYLGLPQAEIDALGLRRSIGTIRLMSATGIVEVETYFANGELRGRHFPAILVPAVLPLMGRQLLENLRFRVNPVSQDIEPVPDGERWPSYL